jgi:ketosteroid isomerase-like protein
MKLRPITFASRSATIAMLVSALAACEQSARRSEGGSVAVDANAAAIQVRDAASAYVSALERGDSATAIAYWDPESRVLGPGMDLDGARTVEFMRSVFASGTRIDVLDRRTLELEVYGDLAFELAQAEEAFLPRDGRPDTVRNNLFVRWKRGADGKWRFNRVLVGPQAAAAPAR